MIAFTIHAYTSDSTEGVLITENVSLSETDAAALWWEKNNNKGNDPIKDWCDIKSIFAIKRELTIIVDTKGGPLL